MVVHIAHALKLAQEYSSETKVQAEARSVRRFQLLETRCTRRVSSNLCTRNMSGTQCIVSVRTTVFCLRKRLFQFIASRP